MAPLKVKKKPFLGSPQKVCRNFRILLRIKRALSFSYSQFLKKSCLVILWFVQRSTREQIWSEISAEGPGQSLQFTMPVSRIYGESHNKYFPTSWPLSYEFMTDVLNLILVWNFTWQFFEYQLGYLNRRKSTSE